MEQFKKRSKALVVKILRVRKHLLKTRQGLCDEPMQQVVDKLDRLINYWPYDSDSKMANFVFGHSIELAFLIPSPKCTLHKTLHAELESICQEAALIITNRQPITA